VLIDDVPVPPELSGRIYADMRPGRRFGYRKILATLEHELSRFAPVNKPSPPSVVATEAQERRRAYESLLGGTFSAFSLESRLAVPDSWEGFTLDDETDVVLEVMPSYGGGSPSISTEAFDRWRNLVADVLGESFGLLITERPLDQRLTEEVALSNNIGMVEIRDGLLVILYLPHGLGEQAVLDGFERALGVFRSAIAERVSNETSHNAVIPSLSVGDEVLHSTFGLGIVEAVWEGDKADVEFASAGRKRLSLAHAPLVPISAPKSSED